MMKPLPSPWRMGSCSGGMPASAEELLEGQSRRPARRLTFAWTSTLTTAAFTDSTSGASDGSAEVASSVGRLGGNGLRERGASPEDQCEGQPLHPHAKQSKERSWATYQ